MDTTNNGSDFAAYLTDEALGARLLLMAKCPELYHQHERVALAQEAARRVLSVRA